MTSGASTRVENTYLSVDLFVKLRIVSGLFCKIRISLTGTCCSSSFWYNFTQRYNTFQLQRNRANSHLPSCRLLRCAHLRNDGPLYRNSIR